MATSPFVELYERDDGMWAWRLLAENNEVVATDHSQGFRDATDAERAATDAMELFVRLSARSAEQSVFRVVGA